MAANEQFFVAVSVDLSEWAAYRSGGQDFEFDGAREIGFVAASVCGSDASVAGTVDGTVSVFEVSTTVFCAEIVNDFCFS